MAVKGRRNNKGQRKRKGPFTKTLVEYCGATSIHGVSYIAEGSRLFFERVTLTM